MSIFDSVMDVVSDFSPVLEVGANLYGAYSSAQANKKATRTAQAGVNRANALTQEQLAKITEATAPAIQHQREVVSRNPYVFTPEEQREIDAIRQSARRTIAGGPLAGSGRAQVRAFNEMDVAARDRITGRNTQRADEAAGRLSSIGFGAMSDQGTSGANAALNTALLGADRTLANQRLTGQAIGDVMSYISDYDKAKKTGVKQTVSSETV